jgi:hypothetical protein
LNGFGNIGRSILCQNPERQPITSRYTP